MNKEEGKGYVTSPSNPNLRIYEPNQIVIKEGDQDDGNIYILNSGKLIVILNEEKVAEISDPGVFIGEMSSILQGPRTATIKTLEESQITVYMGGIEKIVEQLPQVALKIMLQIATRLKDTTALQSESGARADNLGRISNQLRSQYADLKKKYEDLQQKFEELQKEEPKKSKRGFFRR